MGKGFWRAVRGAWQAAVLGVTELQTTKQLSTRRGQMKHWMDNFFMQRGGGYCYLFSYAQWLIG